MGNSVSLTVHFVQACFADQLASVKNHIICIAAEQARGNILLEDDLVLFNENLDGILILDVHLIAKLNREHDSAKFIDAANDTGGFHRFFLL